MFFSDLNAQHVFSATRGLSKMLVKWARGQIHCFGGGRGMGSGEELFLWHVFILTPVHQPDCSSDLIEIQYVVEMRLTILMIDLSVWLRFFLKNRKTKFILKHLKWEYFWFPFILFDSKLNIFGLWTKQGIWVRHVSGILFTEQLIT